MIAQGGLQGSEEEGLLTRNGQSMRYFALVLSHSNGYAVVVGFVKITSSPADIATLQTALHSFRGI